MDNKIRKEIEKLIVTADELVEKASVSGSALGQECVQELSSMAVRGNQLIHRLYGPESQHAKMFQSVLDAGTFTLMHSHHHSQVAQIGGIFKAVRHDLEEGMLVDFRKLVEAEVFSDFLEMAEYLADEGYKDASAVLLGAVLEDALRKLSKTNGISTVNSNGRPLAMDTMNVQLSKSGAYNALVKKQVTSWSNLRNDAAHGRHEGYDADQVKQMLLFVQKFCADFVS